MFPKLNADLKASVVICPTTFADVDKFVGNTLGILETELSGCSDYRSADIALLDQNIELKGEVVLNLAIILLNLLTFSYQLYQLGIPLVLGTTVAEVIRSRGFTGLLLIRSADVSKDYLSGAVDGCIGKDASGTETAQQIRAAYSKKTSSPSNQRS